MQRNCRHALEDFSTTKNRRRIMLDACGFMFYLVPRRGLEPPHLAAHGPEPCASTNSAIWALRSANFIGNKNFVKSK